jgi:hypothetical protein
MPGEAPVGTKRLLELYSEVLAMNNVSVTSGAARKKLREWEKAAGLKKVIEGLKVG